MKSELNAAKMLIRRCREVIRMCMSRVDERSPAGKDAIKTLVDIEEFLKDKPRKAFRGIPMDADSVQTENFSED